MRDLCAAAASRSGSAERASARRGPAAPRTSAASPSGRQDRVQQIPRPFAISAIASHATGPFRQLAAGNSRGCGPGIQNFVLRRSLPLRTGVRDAQDGSDRPERALVGLARWTSSLSCKRCKAALSRRTLTGWRLCGDVHRRAYASTRSQSSSMLTSPCQPSTTSLITDLAGADREASEYQATTRVC